MNIVFRLLNLLTRFLGSILWSLNLLLFLYTLLVYYLCYSLQTEHWVAGIMMMSLPVAWALNVLCIFFWLLVRRPYRSLLSLVTMVAGLPFWPRTFAFHQPENPPAAQPVLRVMSYNVSGFNKYDVNMTQHPDQARPMIEWIVNDTSDVKCFQEYYNQSESVLFSVTRKLERAGYRYYSFLEQKNTPYGEKFVGCALFSRLPILDRGSLSFDPKHNGFNGFVWADVKTRTDTVRVFSVHLESMGIRVKRITEAEGASTAKKEARGIIRSLREGFTLRRDQVRILEEHIGRSPHPVIVCGDFNDTPYSVVYGRLRRQLSNAFESAGWGVDFSYHKPPGFIRIDNQFYDSRSLNALSFATLKEYNFSDHYPIIGAYAVKNEGDSGSRQTGSLSSRP
ncbi:endonuclease/exonuclease/phosphatase family protein [Tellurirhabdus rosea]|uniref:endonuclease/exonuclease/phosphatase family protein n=1 Tax=Tellurirhabdus rosea TaxID=2674997 RepID=UPI00225164FC|nr:endonuclease/exonuclease/phosphatase family protein [Tellurirhabdus rosea]